MRTRTGRKIFIKRPKSWRSEKLTKYCNSLDVYFDDKLLNKRGKDQTIIRESWRAISQSAARKCTKLGCY